MRGEVFLTQAGFEKINEEARRTGGKVVLTGEGSDEVLLGYDLYRETQARRFWARQPASKRSTPRVTCTS